MIVIGSKLSRLPGVKASMVIDTSQFPKRLQNNVVRQLRAGVASRSPIGDLVHKIFRAAYPDGVWPAERWYRSLSIRKQYCDTPEVDDMLDAIVVTATMKGMNGACKTDCDRDERYTRYSWYKGTIQLMDCQHERKMIDMSVSKKWRELIDPVIAGVLAGDTFVCKVTN